MKKENEKKQEKNQEEPDVMAGELKLSNADVMSCRAFYDFSSMGYFILNQDSTICELNRSGAEILGREPSDLVNRKFKSFVTPDTQSGFETFLREVYQSGSRQNCEVRLKIENNITSFVQIDGMVSGNAGRCQITVLDITDRRLAEGTVYNLLNEKEIILKEVHHRVKNNMYNIGALLNMQANAQDEPAAKSVLFDAAGRVQSMSVLYDKLYRSEFNTAVSLKEYFPDLVHEIVGIFPHRKSVKVRTQIDDIVLDAKILSILGILVNELVTNSMKYAFTGRTDGVISVTVSKKEKRITIIIADNGNGIPETITFKNSSGFGMQLVDMLTEQLGGNIRIERGGGTRFVLEFEE
jgi:two-component sensor histidine kinase